MPNPRLDAHKQALDGAQEVILKLRAEVDYWKAVMREYAPQHKSDCDSELTTELLMPCTCGLAEVLKKLEDK